MDFKETIVRVAGLLKELRRKRGISQRQLADESGVDRSVVNRAESGENDAQISTWAKLFQGLGYRLILDVEELCEESADLLAEHAEQRREKRRAGRPRTK